MHLLVPGAYRPADRNPLVRDVGQVSMHLLVPGAYRQKRRDLS